MRNTTKLPVVKIKIFPGGHMPEKKTQGAAAYDCYARVDYCRWIFPGEKGIKVPLGFAIELPEGYHAEILLRSSMGIKTGLRVSNGTGLIDSDYRGAVNIILDNARNAMEGRTGVEGIGDGDRIAQMVIVKDPDVELVQAEKLSETERDTGGFGSTGRRDRQEE